MKHQVLFSSKDKSKKLKCLLLQFLFGALRVKTGYHSYNIRTKENGYTLLNGGQSGAQPEGALEEQASTYFHQSLS